MNYDAKLWFCDLHDNKCNQKYNKNLPYSFHLEMVAAQARKFKKYIPVDNPYHHAVWIGIWGHDSIEDARLTYNDIKDIWGERAAEIIYLCTEWKGRNRAERKPIQFYLELMTNEDAVFVKLCDIIANMKFSLLTNSPMFQKYVMEWVKKVGPTLEPKRSVFPDMFSYIDEICKLD
jgi:(p)ppGpp synthase/HD superfamily hydrolase